MSEFIALLIGALAALLIRKWITKQPLLKARVDSWVDLATDKAKVEFGTKDGM